MSNLISEKYESYKASCNEMFYKLKANEEELNRIFIDIYGLQDELTPEVEDKDVTVHFVADTKEDAPVSLQSSNYLLTKKDVIKQFISYAVGCMFGRYSLDTEGLAYAGGDFSDQWLVISGHSSGRLSVSGEQSCLVHRKEVEYYVGKELSRACGMAEIYGTCARDLPTDEISSERGAICVIRPNEESSSVDSVEYSRGTSKKLYEGIRQLSFDSQRLGGRVEHPIYDLCSPEILDAISSERGDELTRRGFKDADSIDWKAIHCSLTTNHFSPDKDNIIPICDDEYFDDDIVGRFVEFVKTVYGEETLEENLRFIADALDGKLSSRETLRKYFQSNFFADHCKTYQKRPIYWQFSSGKKNGFKALIYMHRYQPDLLARLRTDYVHEQQERYETQIQLLIDRVESAPQSEKVKINKKIAVLRDQMLEIGQFEEKVHHLADMMIPIDLDDGVKVNYAKFQEILEKIK